MNNNNGSDNAITAAALSKLLDGVAVSRAAKEKVIKNWLKRQDEIPPLLPLGLLGVYWQARPLERLALWVEFSLRNKAGGVVSFGTLFANKILA